MTVQAFDELVDGRRRAATRAPSTRRARTRADAGLALLVRLAPPLTLLILVGPLLFGLAFTLAPAFGYLPALGGTSPTLGPFRDLLARPGVWTSAGLSFGTALGTTVISLLLVAAFLGAAAGTRALGRVQGLISPLLAVPHAAAAFGLAFLIAPSGILARAISPWATGWERPPDLLIVHDQLGLAMVAGLVLKEVPFLLLVALAAMPQLRIADTRRLAASLGHGRVAGFLFLVWPRLYAQIRLAVFAVIAYASSVVDVAAILGPQLPPVLAVRLLDWMRDPDLSMRFTASAGAMLQLGVTLAALAAWWLAERIGGALLRSVAMTGHRFRRDRAVRVGASVAMVAVALVTFAGLAALALWSVAGPWRFPDALPPDITFRTWERSWDRAIDPLWTTVWCGALSTLIALLLVIGCLERERAIAGPDGSRAARLANRALPLLYLPLIVPQIAFLFGIQVLLVRTGTEGTAWALIGSHLIFVLPYVFLSLSDPWRAMDGRYDQVAASLGVGRARALWRVRLPMLARAVGVAAGVGFAVSVGQYLPTVLIGAGRLSTITTEAVQLASGGNRRTVAVYAFLQTMLPLAGFLVAAIVPSWLARGRRGLRP